MKHDCQETNVVWWVRTKMLPEQLADKFYSVTGELAHGFLGDSVWLLSSVPVNDLMVKDARDSGLRQRSWISSDLFCLFCAISRSLISRSCESLCFSRPLQRVLYPDFQTEVKDTKEARCCSRVRLSASFCFKTKESDNELNQQQQRIHQPKKQKGWSELHRSWFAISSGHGLMRWAGQSPYISPMSAWTCGKMLGKNLSCA